MALYGEPVVSINGLPSVVAVGEEITVTAVLANGATLGAGSTINWTGNDIVIVDIIDDYTAVIKFAIKGIKSLFAKNDNQSSPKQVSTEVVELTMSIPDTNLYLCENFNITIETGSTSFFKHRLEIKEKLEPDSSYVVLSDLQPAPNSTSTTYNMPARVAGEFRIRASAKPVGQPNYIGTTSARDVTVNFPTGGIIAADTGFKAIAGTVWDDTKNAATLTTVVEKGSWVLLNTATCTYSFHSIKTSDQFSYGIQASVNLGPTPADSPSSPGPLDSPTYMVASFHTHTSLAKEQPPMFRTGLVGPSPEDSTLSLFLKIPGLVYDYVGDDLLGNGVYWLQSSHGMNDSAKIYDFGEVLRPLP